RDAVEQAFCGTVHIEGRYEQRNGSYGQAVIRELPESAPCEVYLDTRTDDSILSPELRGKGFHTMTLFGLDAPYSLFARNNEKLRRDAQRKFIDSINQWLEEPIEDCLAVARDGDLCIESKSLVDVDQVLGMYHGNIFQDV